MDRIVAELGGIVESPINYSLLPTTRFLIPFDVLRISVAAGSALVGVTLAVIMPLDRAFVGLGAWFAMVQFCILACIRSYVLVWGEDRLALVRWGMFTHRTMAVVLDTAPALCRAERVATRSDTYPQFRLETPAFTWRLGTSRANREAVDRLVGELARPSVPPPPIDQTAT